MCSDLSLNSSIYAITVIYSERIVKTRSEYSHQKCGIVIFSVSETFPALLLGSYKIALFYWF